MPKKLLLADDSVTIQRVIELTFSGEDVQVLAVGDGEEAIARIPIERPDIILADIGMPKRSGYEVSAFVKNNPEFAHIPVLLLAGAFEPVDDAKAKEARCDGVLVKPFEPQHVIARVLELIGGAKGSPTQSAVQDIPRPAARLAPPRPVELPKREDRVKVPDDFMDMGEADLEPRIEETLSAAPPLELEDSLDDYFDKLDEAFSSIGGTSASGSVAPSRTEARPSRPDRPVLERDLESFDGPLLIDPPAPPQGGSPEAAEADPFAGLVDVDLDHASAAVPTIDDLLARMPPPAEAPPMTFEMPPPVAVDSPSITFEPAPPAPMVFEPPPAAVTPPVVAAPPVAAPPPIVVPPPAAAPPPVAVPRPPAAPPVAPAPLRPAAPLDSGSSRSIIADAFSALLAVEQGEPGAAPVRLGGNGTATVVTDAMVDDVARRVIERLALGSSDQMSAIVRQIVSDVAERLVRDEIERIRSKQ